MIEVTVAIAAASKAITVIKKGLALGRDTQELSSQFAQFFDAKDKIDKAKAEVADIKNLELIINPIIDNFKDFIASEKKRLSDLKREAKEMKRIKKLREEKYKV